MSPCLATSYSSIPQRSSPIWKTWPVSPGGSRWSSGTPTSTTKVPPGSRCTAAFRKRDLRLLCRQVPDRVVDEVDEGERAIHTGRREVADRHRDRRPASPAAVRPSPPTCRCRAPARRVARVEGRPVRYRSRTPERTRCRRAPPRSRRPAPIPQRRTSPRNPRRTSRQRPRRSSRQHPSGNLRAPRCGRLWRPSPSSDRAGDLLAVHGISGRGGPGGVCLDAEGLGAP